MPPSPSIAATLIVRNEARCLARCLDSITPWVDRIVVLDTGSTDDSVAIAQAAGAEVHHLPWPDSFSIARNHLLDLADSDWSLMLDADEWLMTGGEALRDWCNGPARLGRVCIHNQHDDGETATRSWITRLIPRGARYEGRVHEQVASPLPRVALPVHLGHDGYLAAQIAPKRHRNHMLLQRDLAEQPDDPYLHYQIARDARMRDDLDSACTHFAQALALTPTQANWRHELVWTAITIQTQAGRLDEALALADREMPLWPESPDFFFVLGDLLLDRAMADPANAIAHWLPLAEGAWQRCLAIGERPELEGSVAGRGSHLAQHNLHVIRSQLAMLAA
ncbi:glycosyltransferase [Sphingomonas sanguinis]|uniref:Glycosyltransferase n=1 Tax=Sphingomonas sanguinis TaxID=33051 RepID=A0ABU5LSR0_9SPHN|nr:glycosyltransferase family 2 protein [Sphingomonas sanguinis]MDZ7282761.1 glycosyltransferase [Sphingomonas sanguinis]QXT35204.1 glycosyltransferase [Sphingomonas sanguinis]